MLHAGGLKALTLILMIGLAQAPAHQRPATEKCARATLAERAEDSLEQPLCLRSSPLQTEVSAGLPISQMQAISSSPFQCFARTMFGSTAPEAIPGMLNAL